MALALATIIVECRRHLPAVATVLLVLLCVIALGVVFALVYRLEGSPTVYNRRRGRRR